MTAADRFAAVRDGVHRALPPRLRRIVQPTMIGFAVLNGFTYSVDLSLLYLLDSVLHVPYPVAVSVSYAIALSLAFILNRWLNFQAHGDVGQQGGRYVVAVVLNYVLFILGLASFLEAQGVPGLLARLVAGACEGIYMYCAMRWFVFPGARR